MKKDLLGIIACPICKGDLELQSSEEDNGEVITGNLYCPKCLKHYTIKDGIHDLLPPMMDNSAP